MKRTFCVLLALLVALSCAFAGGSGENTAAEAGQTVTAEMLSQHVGTPEAPVQVTYLYKDIDPIVDADICAVLEKEIEEGLAAQGDYIDLVFLSAPTGSYATVVPIAFRTGQINPDIIYFQGGDQAVADEGLLEDLTPYIESSTYVKQILDMEPHAKEQIANYPYLLWLEPPRIKVPVLRQDWFEAMSTSEALMADPTLENYLAFFRELKASGLCTWPITLDGATQSDGSILELDNMFNHAFGITSTITQDENGDWVYSVTTENEKAKLAFYAQLYNEGLLDNGYVTKTWETKEQSFYEGESAMVMATAGDTLNVYSTKMKETQGQDLVVLPPAKGESWAYKSVDVTKATRGIAINAYSEVKVAAWKVLEFMASPEGRVIDKLGLEGIHYNVENGKYVLTGQYSSWWARCWTTIDNLDMSKVDGQVLSDAALESLDMVQEYFADDINVILPEDLVPLKDAMDSLYREYATDIIRGVRPVDDFEKFVEQWNQAGGTKITEYLNSVLG